MKKAKILVPAMGMMLLSTAAAVSGTMAWFSANRAATVETNNFQVESTDGSLAVEVANLVGTSVDTSGTNPVVSVLSNVKLVDASYDYAHEYLFTDHVDANDAIDGYTNVGSLPASADNTKWLVDGAPTGTVLYYGVAFQMTFTYTFTANTRPVGLFFDAAASLASLKVNNATPSLDSSKHTARGFRMSFATSDDAFAWAPLRNTTDTYDHDANNETAQIAVPQTYIMDVDKDADPVPAVTAYDMTADAEEALYGNESSSLALATDGNATTHRGYLGEISKEAGAGNHTGSIDVNVVVWFEGTDPDVVNNSTMDAVKSNLKFYVRTNSTATPIV